MDPAFLTDMSWRMAEVYGAVTDRILINLARHFPYIKDSRQAKMDFSYQVKMLAQMGQVRKETVDIIAGSLAGGDAALRASLETAIIDALKKEEPALVAAAQKGLLGVTTPPTVTPNQMQAFQMYYQQSADKLNLVNTVMLESTESAYAATVSDVTQRLQRTQGFLNVAAGETITGVSSYNKAMHDAVQKMVSNGLTVFIDHGGHRWSPEAYVAMDIRTTMFNTARAAVWERASEYGSDLYQVSSHNGARPLCYPWQGKILSTSGRTGITTDLDGNEIQIHSESEVESFRWGGGLFGVNCGHYPMTFIPGFSTLKGEPQDEEENAKTYAESQEQRALERKLREERRDLAVMQAQGADEATIKAQQAKVDAASDAIDEFCDRTGRARRKSREYTPVNATFPDKDTYNPAEFPTTTKDQIKDWFSDNPPDEPPKNSIHLGPDDIPPTAQVQVTAPQEAPKGDGYTQAEKDAVEDYVSGNGMWVNKYLRDESAYTRDYGPLSADEKQFIRDLDSATEKKTVPDKVLYRSVDAQAVFGRMTDTEFENLRGAVVYGDTSAPAKTALAKANTAIGKNRVEKGYMSTTRDAEVAYQWFGFTGSTKDITLELHLPDGIKGFDVEKAFEVDENAQKEVLLQRGLTYRVEGVEKRDSEDGSVISVIASVLGKN